MKSLLPIALFALATIFGAARAHALPPWFKESAPSRPPPSQPAYGVDLDNRGFAVDAHDGKLLRFGSAFYLYGTSYGCGFQWKKYGSPICGFKVYRSTDLVNWQDAGRDRGFLFDPDVGPWQGLWNTDPNLASGAFRPHVLRTRRGQYILWVNAYKSHGLALHVFASDSPAGPFRPVEKARGPWLPDLGFSPEDFHAGDFDLFTDHDGKHYAAITDWKAGGQIVIAELNADGISGTGRFVRTAPKSVEAPSLFRWQNRYYLTFSDPNCGYCITGTSYLSAPSPLGPWNEVPTKISGDSCGGQPAAVSEFRGPRGPVLVYQSDRWHNLDADPAANISTNQALAAYFRSALKFDRDGNILPIDCRRPLRPADLGLPTAEPPVATAPPKPVPVCDIGGPSGRSARLQLFKLNKPVQLKSISFLTFQAKHPSSNLRAELVELSTDRSRLKILRRLDLSPQQISWAPGQLKLHWSPLLLAGRIYGLRLSTPDGQGGCFGWGAVARNDDEPAATGLRWQAVQGTADGRHWTRAGKRRLQMTLQSR